MLAHLKMLVCPKIFKGGRGFEAKHKCLRCDVPKWIGADVMLIGKMLLNPFLRATALL